MTFTFEKQVCHGGRLLPWHTLMLALVTTLLFVFAGPAPEVLVVDRQAILAGEVWRLVTGHWVHSDIEHFTLNLIAFVLLGYLVECYLGFRMLYAALTMGTLFVDICVLLFMPGLDLYCGLSGVLNTLLFVFVVYGCVSTNRIIYRLVFIAASGKIVLELFQNSALLTSTYWPSVPQAHLAGALAAMVVISMSLAIDRMAESRQVLKGSRGV